MELGFGGLMGRMDALEAALAHAVQRMEETRTRTRTLT